jgi:DNA invertase Pin-like site-specific DNA recombinase
MPSTPTATAFSYIRFSHPDQAKGDSLRRQAAAATAWCERNGVALDTSLSLQDKGVSGFSGAHRKNPDRHALAAFLKLVEKGDDRVPRGSYLIIENLDRLSREHIRPALSLLLNLIEAGVRVVQLTPVEFIYDEAVEPTQIMMAIMELSRGHSESAMKSKRLGSAWREKKRRAAAERKPTTARTPSWLRLVAERDSKGRLSGGKFEVVKVAAATVREVFHLAAAGLGIVAITKRLNATGVPVIGIDQRRAESRTRLRAWGSSFVAKLLSNRAVLGEYQPYAGRGNCRKKDGEPVAGYYPAILSPPEWYAARKGLEGRRGKAGRPAKDKLNLFSGLLHDARDGGKIQVVDKGKKSHRPGLVSAEAVKGAKGSHYVSFPLPVFEAAVLAGLREIDPRELLPQTVGEEADKVAELEARLADRAGWVEQVKARLQTRYSDALADMLERGEDEVRALTNERDAARMEAATPRSVAWDECISLAASLAGVPEAEQEGARWRLRAALRRTVAGLHCVFAKRDSLRLAYVQMTFPDGHGREWLVLSRPGLGGSVGKRPSAWCMACWPEREAGADFDLREAGSGQAVYDFLGSEHFAPLLREMEVKATPEGGRPDKRVLRQVLWGAGG